MSAETRNMRQLWRTVLHHALLDWRKEWLKASDDRRGHVVEDVRRYLASRDGREVVDLCGWQSSPIWIVAAISAVSAPLGESPIDDRRRGAA